MKNATISALRRERERRGWSRNYIAEQVEVDMITVGRWERGERMPHPYHRQKLCTLFEMNAQDLDLLPALPEESHDAANVPTSPPENAGTGTSKESNDAAIVPVPPPETPNAIIIVPDSSLQPPAMNTNAGKVPALLHHRRMFLLTGLGGLGVTALIGGGLLAFSHLSTASMPLSKRSRSSLPISMPLSKRSHRFLDENTGNFVNATAWSPDNSNIALANGTNEVSIWSIENQVLALYCPTLPLDGWVNDVTWSKANLIAAATADKYSGSLQVWKFPDKKPVFTLQRSYPLHSVSWSPDGKYLAFSGHSPTVEIWDPFAARMVSQYSASSLGLQLLGFERVKWSASGRFLASGADDGTVHIWEALTGKRGVICRGHQGRVIDLSWSPDERHIVSGCVDATCRVWAASTGQSIYTYRGHTDEVHGVDWSPKSNLIASGGKDRTVQVWEPFTGKLIAIYRGHSSFVYSVLWSRDGTALAIGTEQEGAEIWQAPPMSS